MINVEKLNQGAKILGLNNGKGGFQFVEVTPPTPEQPNDEIWYNANKKLKLVFYCSIDDEEQPYTPEDTLQFFGANWLEEESTYDEATGNGMLKFDGDVTKQVCWIVDEETDYIYMAKFDAIDDGACEINNIISPSSVVEMMDAYSVWNEESILHKVTLPSTLTSINDSAFEYSIFENCDIPSTVNSIGDGAFANSNIKAIYIPSTVNSIGDGAFAGSSLETLEIAEGITVISYQVCAYCNALTYINIPLSVTEIGQSAFAACSSLVSVVIPSSISAISGGAFAACSSLTSCKVLATTPPTLAPNVFGNTSASLKIYVPSESVDAYKAADGWKTYASKIEAITE